MKILRLFVLMLFLGMPGYLYSQCSLYEISLQERLSIATAVFEGKVVKNISFWDEAHERIYTVHTIELYKIFKGQKNQTESYVITSGGIVGNDMEKTSSLLSLQIGDFGIFICEPNTIHIPQNSVQAQNVLQVVASKQGFIKYDVNLGSANDVFTQYEDIINGLYPRLAEVLHKSYKTVRTFEKKVACTSYEKTASIPFIDHFSPTVIPAGTIDRLTIYGMGFGAIRGSGRVGFKNTNDGGKTIGYADANQYISWDDQKIVLELPDSAGTGSILVENGSGLKDSSRSVLTIPYSRINIKYNNKIERPQLINKDGSGGYVWQMNTDFESHTEMKDAFLNSMAAWRCNTLVNWAIGESSTLSKRANDNINLVLLDTKDRLPKGVLGICYSYYSACSNDGIWYVNGYDIQFRDTTIWHLGSGPITRFQYDMESVMMHELGHGQQLNHVINQADLMHYSLKRATIKRTINPSNTEGAKSILNASIYSGACNYFPLQLVNSATCSDPKLAFYTLGEMEINPNPFFEMATAFYYLDAPAHVTIDLYSVIGQKITTLADEDKPAGKHLQTIDPLQNNLNKGVYIIRLVVGDHEYSKKIVSLF